MANITISPNMNLPVPTVGVDPGPDWATNVDACLNAIDSHDHTPSQGVAIPPQGLNINSDLTFQAHNATALRSVRFNPNGSPLNGAGDIGCIYESGVDLWYNDGGGNQIQLTSGGSPAGATGTITGLPSGTASASFAGTTFTFQSATNTPASLAVGPVTIAQPVASGFGVTISPSVSQAANYNLALPAALPAVSSAVVTDASGNLSFVPLGGTYTPTITSGGAGTVQAAIGPFFYSRVGNIVTVAGRLTGTTNGASNLSTNITLPVNPSAFFVNTYDATGILSTYFTSAQNSVSANPGSFIVQAFLGLINAGSNNLNGSYTVSFTYSCA